MRRITPLLAVAATALALVAPSAMAADGKFDCEATALRGTVAGQAIAEPAVANRGAGECRNASASSDQPLPAPLSGSVIAARTVADAKARQFFAVGGLGSVGVGALPDLGIRLPAQAVLDAVGAITVPLPTASVTSTIQPVTSCTTGVVGGVLGLLGGAGEQICTTVNQVVAGTTTALPSSITVDLRPAVAALLPSGGLPTAPLLQVDGAVANAAVRCVSGKPEFASSSQVGGVRVLGQDLGIGKLVDQTITIGDTAAIDFSRLDLSQVVLPAGLSLSTPGVGTILQTAISGVLAQIPPVQIPAAVAQVKVTPGAETKTATALTRQGARVQVSLLGQSVADVVVGEAKVSLTGTPCADGTETATPVTPSDVALECTTRRLVLTDVLARNGRVRLVGAADRKLAGKTARIVFRATGRTVATVKIKQNGSFTTTAAMPSRRLRASNLARYQAVIGKDRSLDLKLQRRMVVESTRSSGGKVTIAGRVTGPLGRAGGGVSKIVLQRRVSCKRLETVRSFRPSANGTFRVTVDAPKGSVAVFRLATKVRNNPRNPKLFPTFTLPRAVQL